MCGIVFGPRMNSCWRNLPQTHCNHCTDKAHIINPLEVQAWCHSGSRNANDQFMKDVWSCVQGYHSTLQPTLKSLQPYFQRIVHFERLQGQEHTRRQKSPRMAKRNPGRHVGCTHTIFVLWCKVMWNNAHEKYRYYMMGDGGFTIRGTVYTPDLWSSQTDSFSCI